MPTLSGPTTSTTIRRDRCSSRSSSPTPRSWTYIPFLRLTFGSSFAYVLAQVGLRWCCSASPSGSCAASWCRSSISAWPPTRWARAATSRFRLLRWHARGAQCRDRVQDHGHPAAPLDPAAHRDAGRRQPRPAHAAHPHETLAGDAARVAGDQGAGRRRRRHGAMIEGYLAFARGEGDEEPVADRPRRPGGRGRRRPARQRRCRGRLHGRHGRQPAADRHQALPHQPRLQRAALWPTVRVQAVRGRDVGRDHRRRRRARHPARPVRGRVPAVLPARRIAQPTPAAWAWASPSPATWRAATAATRLASSPLGGLRVVSELPT